LFSTVYQQRRSTLALPFRSSSWCIGRGFSMDSDCPTYRLSSVLDRGGSRPKVVFWVCLPCVQRPKLTEPPSISGCWLLCSVFFIESEVIWRWVLLKRSSRGTCISSAHGTCRSTNSKCVQVSLEIATFRQDSPSIPAALLQFDGNGDTQILRHVFSHYMIRRKDILDENMPRPFRRNLKVVERTRREQSILTTPRLVKIPGEVSTIVGQCC